VRRLIRAALSALSFAAFLFTLTVVAQAQQAKKLFRIGFISPEHPGSPRTEHLNEAFRQGLRDLGYIEGQHVTVEYRYAEGKTDRIRQLAAELVGLKVDIIVAVTDPAIQTAKDATKTIPIIMVSGGRSPVEAGFVNSLAHPGGNVTGFTNLGVEMSEKRLDLFKEAVPKVKHVAVLYDPTNRGNVAEVQDVLPKAAHQLGLTIQPFEVRGADGFEKTFTAITRERPDGIYFPGGVLLNANDKRTADFALTNRLPSVYLWSESVDVGGLLSYGPSYMAAGRGIARFVDRILKSAKPADLPVEQPTKFEFVINLKTAKHIGLDIPQSVLFRADRVIR
jgi:putative tryptophan/tyrosine transport system substrate-binding protein